MNHRIILIALGSVLIVSVMCVLLAVFILPITKSYDFTFKVDRFPTPGDLTVESWLESFDGIEKVLVKRDEKAMNLVFYLIVDDRPFVGLTQFPNIKEKLRQLNYISDENENLRGVEKEK